jgi:hypothetical protein
MARRGSNAFRRNDALRLMRVARDAGLDPSTLEVVIAADGATTLRVHSAKGVLETTREDAGAEEWRQAIEDLKAKGKTKER